MSKKNCLVAQSGGPTVAINASLAGVIEAAMYAKEIDTVYGGKNGIQGILEDSLVALNPLFQDASQIKALVNTPSMYLGSCRYKLKDEETSPEDYDRIEEIFKKYNIGYFFYIGGNDSMDTVDKLSRFAKKRNLDVKVVGIPKTIDNDLNCIDHTPGFGSAAKYIATSVLEMAHDTYIYHIDTVLIVEVMGRNAGWLTASAALARNSYSEAPHLIYLPEVAFHKERFVEDVKNLLATKHHVIVAVSEGIKDEDGKYISSQGGVVDKFGHTMLSGTGKVLENLVKAEIGCKVRSVELNVLQRAASHIASKTDLDESFKLGNNGVSLALEGKTGVMSTLQRLSNSPYTVEYGAAAIGEIANYEKTIPREWINREGNDVTDLMMDYLRPLVRGENQITYQDGIPSYLFLQ
ncbi:MAG: 6-phosphofructokinase [Lachnospiraceae bacterium]|nr:6-phosphofructokinase [Lachnospiraceae bacterium]